MTDFHQTFNQILETLDQSETSLYLLFPREVLLTPTQIRSMTYRLQRRGRSQRIQHLKINVNTSLVATQKPECLQALEELVISLDYVQQFSFLSDTAADLSLNENNDNDNLLTAADVGRLIHACGPQLRSLFLDVPTAWQEQVHLFLNVSHPQALHKLEVQWHGFRAHPLDEFSQQLLTLTHLQDVTVGLIYVSTPSLDIFLTKLDSFPRLVSCAITSIKQSFSRESLGILNRLIQKGRLQSLFIYNFRGDPQCLPLFPTDGQAPAVQEFATAIQNSTSLKSLVLLGVLGAHEDIVAAVFQSMEQNKLLRGLVVTPLNLTATGWTRIMQSLAHNQQLLFVEFIFVETSVVEMNDAVIATIADGLQHNTSITKFTCRQKESSVSLYDPRSIRVCSSSHDRLRWSTDRNQCWKLVTTSWQGRGVPAALVPATLTRLSRVSNDPSASASALYHVVRNLAGSLWNANAGTPECTDSSRQKKRPRRSPRMQEQELKRLRTRATR